MRRPLLTLAFLAALVPALGAQAAAPAKSSLGAEAIRGNWETVTGYIIRAAEQVPEADYGFKPTPEVRSFGELFGHVAGAQDMFCALALGEPAPAEDAVEKAATGKAALVAALRKSTENCNRAYRQADAALAGDVQVFGKTRTRRGVLAMNALHNGEHYGNIVT